VSRFTLALGVALLVVEAVAAVAIIATGVTGESRGVIVLEVTASVGFVVAGLIALSLRPDNRTGVYLAATGYVWPLGALTSSPNEWVFTIGYVLGDLVWIPFTALVLAYPTGRLATRLERAIPLAAGALVVSTALAQLLFDPDPAPERCDDCAGSAIVISDAPSVGQAVDLATTIVGLGLIAVAVVILYRRWRTASPAARHLLWPVAGAGAATLVAVALVIVADQFSARVADAFQVVLLVTFTLVPFAFLFGVLQTRLSRTPVSDLVVALDEEVLLRDALANALDDPSLAIVYPLDGSWVDEDGTSTSALDGPERILTPVEVHGKVVAGLVHDSSLSYNPALVEGVVGAAALALRAQGLQAEANAQFAFLRTLVETAPSLVIHVGTDGTIRNQNAAAVEAAGYDDEEIVRGRPFWDVFIAPEERDEVVARFRALAPDFEAGEYENAFTNARGERRVIFWRSAPVQNDAGVVTGIISGGIDITERRKRELELERERDATTTTLEAIPSIMVVLDRDGVMRDRDVDNPRVGANRAFRQALGWRDDELVGYRFTELVVDDADGRAQAAIAMAAAGNASHEVESELRCADGSVKAFAWTAVPVIDITGRTDGLVLVSGVEVTERRRLELEKERERTFLNAVAAAVPSLLCLIDEQGRNTPRGANTAFERALGYAPHEIDGQVFWEHFVDESERDDVRRVIEDVMAGGESHEHDNSLVTSSGERLSVAWTCTALPPIDDRRLFLVTGLDVTERKRREEETRSAEERFRAVIESSPVAIAEIDMDDKVKLWNPAAERIFGWSADEVLGKPPVWVPADLAAEYRALSAREAGGDGYAGFETVRMHRDGRRVDVEIAAAPIRDGDGGVVGAMAVLNDISDRKRHEEELRASRARIVAAGDEARQRLERNLHDGAQQRLVALSVALRLAETRLEEDPDEATRILTGARAELAQALEELRELARGIHPAILTDRGLSPALTALAARTPLPVEIDVQEAALPAAVEAASYYVVAESLTNVVKYAEASEIRVTVSSDEGRVVVEVSDDGTGGADPTQGSGLRGLADRVASLDGELVVESPPGHGTTVRAEIPLADGSP
jgi:PAS domain S-box-containing protein